MKTPYFAIKPNTPGDLKKAMESLLQSELTKGHWLALVDTAFNENDQPPRQGDRFQTPLYHQGRLERLLPVSPVLIEVSADAPERLSEQLKHLAYRCHAKPMLSLIQTMHPAQVLRDNWQPLLEVETEENDVFLLRFADTRVLPAIAAIDSVWNRLAAPVSAWWIVGRDGQLQKLTPPMEPANGKEPLKIGSAAYGALVNAGRIDAIAAYLYEFFPNLLLARDGYANYLQLSQVANLCDRCGIEGSSEQHALAVATLISDGRLLETDGFDQWLSAQSWRPGSLEDALADWMDEKEITCVN